MMMLKEQFRKFNNHVGQKKISKDQGKLDKLNSASTNPSSSASTPRSSSSTITASSPVPASLKRQLKGALQATNSQSSPNSSTTTSSDPNYVYESQGSLINRIPSNYLHQLKETLQEAEPGIFHLSTSQLNKVLDSWFSTPLPNASKLFPYLHGAISQTQCDFLDMEPGEDELPNVRYLLVIKSNDVDNCTMIKSTVTPDDIYIEPLMNKSNASNAINLRNYSSQITLLSKISDFVIYNEDNHMEDNLTLAHELISLQRPPSSGSNKRHYNTFILDYEPKALSAKYKINQDLTKLSPTTALHFTMNNWNMNYLFHERVEMWLMTSKHEIHKNLYLGNVNDLHPENTHDDEFGLVINCHEGVRIPTGEVIDKLMMNAKQGVRKKVAIDFTSSGSYSTETMTDFDVEGVVKLCKLIYHYNVVLNKKVFIYCFDGYSAFSFLVLAYEMYKTGDCLAQAILNYFMIYKRPLYFFKNDYDVLLQVLQKDLIQNSPRLKTIHEDDDDHVGADEDTNSLTSSINSMKLSSKYDQETQQLEDWLTNSNDKNPPSRIFPYLYLGTFEHASCSALLSKLQVSQIISFGQIPTWMNDLDMDKLQIDKHYASATLEESSAIYVYHNPLPNIKKLIHVPYLEDDGKCSIINFFEKIYRLVKTGDVLPLNNEINLIHCRVGVSRSASFCILETMKLLNVSLPRAYLYVRVRRLNIIIQPNLKIFYELLKIEQCLKKEREIDWHILCREIDYLNRRYF